MIEPVTTELQVPPGMAGPDAVTIEVRCFVVSDPGGIVLIDAGPPGTAARIEAVLGRHGASWADVRDIVLTHRHFDHVGGLDEVAGHSPRAEVWAGASDVEAIGLADGRVVRPLTEGDRVRDLRVLDTPGHTPGHIALLHEPDSMLLVGDLVGSRDGELDLGPAAFTADPVLARRSLARVPGVGASRVLFSHGAEISDPNEAIGALLASPPTSPPAGPPR